MGSDEQLVKWALGMGFATGHAETNEDLLDEVGEQIRELRAERDALMRGLRMAKFALHKVRLKYCAIDVWQGRKTRDEVAEKYRLAMNNFDDIVKLAKTEPERMFAVERDLARGFYMPGDDLASNVD